MNPVRLEPIACPFAETDSSRHLDHGQPSAGAHPAVTLSQHWLGQPEAGFRPTRVWPSWSPEGLHILAEMEDDAIGNTARGDRVATWETGDVFEIFLRPPGQDAYFEFHITPENETLRVRFPSAAYFEAMSARFHHDAGWVFDLSLSRDCLRTTARADHAGRRWWAGAFIPFTTVLENGTVPPAGPWMASFCRYDCTPGSPRAVLSSSSPHPGPRPRFHDQAFWRPLEFATPP